MFAREAWPDLHAWPTRETIERLRSQIKGDPRTRLAVLTGLRLFAESSSNTMLGLAAFFISLIAVALALIPLSPSWYLLVVIPAGAFTTLLVCFYIPAAVALETRRKAAIMWLRAIEGN